MGRKSGIWLRKQNKTWYVNHRGRQINLGKDKAAAEKQFYRLMAEEEAIEARSITAAELFDKFLLWCRDNRAIRTFEWYRDHLQMLLDHLPDQNIAATDLKPYHVYEVCKPAWSPSYKRGFIHDLVPEGLQVGNEARIHRSIGHRNSHGVTWAMSAHRRTKEQVQQKLRSRRSLPKAAQLVSQLTTNLEIR